MRLRSQNLTDGRLPKFWYGRAWLGKDYQSRQLRIEWSLGKFARGFSVMVSFGVDDGDDGVMFHLCIPWIFSIFITIDRVYRCEECACGLTVHDGAIWFYPLAWRMKSATKEDPWYRRYFCWHFPWSLDWWSTEILKHGANTHELGVEWSETRKNRKKWTESQVDRQMAENRVSRVYPYAYILRNRQIQYREATVHVERMTWRARWYPLIPLVKVRTSIDVRFNEEVGEETGSWKGGCIGCGYNMKYGETPERCLSRMEHEREFRR